MHRFERSVDGEQAWELKKKCYECGTCGTVKVSHLKIGRGSCSSCHHARQCHLTLSVQRHNSGHDLEDRGDQKRLKQVQAALSFYTGSVDEDDEGQEDEESVMAQVRDELRRAPADEWSDTEAISVLEKATLLFARAAAKEVEGESPACRACSFVHACCSCCDCANMHGCLPWIVVGLVV